MDLTRPGVMGILNVTPDSFSDGGLYDSKDAAVDRIGRMVEEGAQIIDVGGESTRPGAEPVGTDDELKRVLPVLESALPHFREVLFSVDTTKYAVAEAALEAGVDIVNDISGLRKEPGFVDLCRTYGAGYILMHSQGDPVNMQDDPSYGDVVGEIAHFFQEQLTLLRDAGIPALILDPGIGFGKNLEHNVKIVSNLDRFTQFGYPVLAGASRKSMIGTILNNRPVTDRLTGTIAVHYHCLMKGAKLLRVHDVKEAVDSITIYNAIGSAAQG